MQDHKNRDAVLLTQIVVLPEKRMKCFLSWSLAIFTDFIGVFWPIEDFFTSAHNTRSQPVKLCSQPVLRADFHFLQTDLLFDELQEVSLHIFRAFSKQVGLKILTKLLARRAMTQSSSTYKRAHLGPSLLAAAAGVHQWSLASTFTYLLCIYQNLQWKLGRLTPSFGSIWAYLETTA